MDRKCQPFGRQSSLLADTLPGQSWEHDREAFDSTTLENWTSLKKKGIKSQFFLYDKFLKRLFKKRFWREFFDRSFFDRFLIILKISGQIFTLERRSCSGKIFLFFQHRGARDFSILLILDIFVRYLSHIDHSIFPYRTSAFTEESTCNKESDYEDPRVVFSSGEEHLPPVICHRKCTWYSRRRNVRNFQSKKGASVRRRSFRKIR